MKCFSILESTIAVLRSSDVDNVHFMERMADILKEIVQRIETNLKRAPSGPRSPKGWSLRARSAAYRRQFVVLDMR